MHPTNSPDFLTKLLKNNFIPKIETKVGVEHLTMQNALKGDVWSNSIRWAVNINDWIPTQQEWVKVNFLKIIFYISQWARKFKKVLAKKTS